MTDPSTCQIVKLNYRVITANVLANSFEIILRSTLSALDIFKTLRILI